MGKRLNRINEYRYQFDRVLSCISRELFWDEYNLEWRSDNDWCIALPDLVRFLLADGDHCPRVEGFRVSDINDHDAGVFLRGLFRILVNSDSVYGYCPGMKGSVHSKDEYLSVVRDIGFKNISDEVNAYYNLVDLAGK